MNESAHFKCFLPVLQCSTLNTEIGENIDRRYILLRNVFENDFYLTYEFMDIEIKKKILEYLYIQLILNS